MTDEAFYRHAALRLGIWLYYGHEPEFTRVTGSAAKHTRPSSPQCETAYVESAKVELLAKLDLFSGLSHNEIVDLARIGVEKSYESGDTLFTEGQPCGGLWVLAAGAARIVKTTRQGRQVVLATQTAPSTVAEVPVFDGGAYPASLIAVQPTKALWIARQDFLNLCRQHPNLTLRFLAMFGRRLRHLVHLVEQITFGSIRQRLAQDLLSKADLSGAPSFRLEETHEQLAAQLGSVREVISRNLSRFQSEGFIHLDRRTVTILDRQGLENEAITEF